MICPIMTGMVEIGFAALNSSELKIVECHKEKCQLWVWDTEYVKMGTSDIKEFKQKDSGHCGLVRR